MFPIDNHPLSAGSGKGTGTAGESAEESKKGKGTLESTEEGGV